MAADGEDEGTYRQQTSPIITLRLREESTDSNLANLYSNNRASLLVDVYIYYDGCTLKDGDTGNIGLCLTDWQPTETNSIVDNNMEHKLVWEEYASQTLYKSHPSNRDVSPPSDLTGYTKYTFVLITSLDDIVTTPGTSKNYELMAYAYLENYYSESGMEYPSTSNDGDGAGGDDSETDKVHAEDYTVCSKYNVVNSANNVISNSSVLTILCTYKPEIVFEEDICSLTEFGSGGDPFFTTGSIVGLIPKFNGVDTPFEFRSYRNDDDTVLELDPPNPFAYTNSNSKCVSIGIASSMKGKNECIRVVTHEDSTSDKITQDTYKHTKPWYSFIKKASWVCSFSYYHLESNGLSNDGCASMSSNNYRHYDLQVHVMDAYGGERQALISFSWGFDKNAGISHTLVLKAVPEHR